MAAAGFVLLSVLVAFPAGRDLLARMDDVWNTWMWDLEVPILMGVAKFLSRVGSSVVMTPVRVGVAVWLLARRRYAALVGWLVVVMLSEVAIHVLKPAFDRARPPGQLVVTASAAFPSGHVVGAASTALAMVLVLTFPGPRRLGWKIVAYCYVGLMAWSRTYVHAHWLTDVVGGALLGAVIAVGPFLVIDAWARRQSSSEATETDASSFASDTSSSTTSGV